MLEEYGYRPARCCQICAHFSSDDNHARCLFHEGRYVYLAYVCDRFSFSREV